MTLKHIKLTVAIVLLGGIFAVSFWQVIGSRASRDPNVTVIRIGHWLLHSGMREAFDEAGRDYEALHPDIKVEQIAVPIKGWGSWARTQLIGETAPEVMGSGGLGTAVQRRYMIPLSDTLEEPNPYNAGTDLEGVPWRDTFVDGLTNTMVYNRDMGEHFGIMLQINSMRLFVNLDLLDAVTGSREPPQTFDDLRALVRDLKVYNGEHGSHIVAISSCKPYSRSLFQRVLTQLTQKLAIELSPDHNLLTSTLNATECLLNGSLSYRTPAVMATLSLLKELGSMMQPGFLQMQREDSHFHFFQQGSVMIYTGSWDYGTLRTEAAFPVVAARLPIPGPDDEIYGPYVLGPIAESNLIPEAVFGVPHSAENREIAIDFMKFLTSQSVSKKFCDRSLRMSAIVGVIPPPEQQALLAITDGELSGFDASFQNFSTGHTSSLFSRNTYRMLGTEGTVENLVVAMEAGYLNTARNDLIAQVKTDHRNIREADTRISLLLARNADGDLERALALLESQTALERQTARVSAAVEGSREPDS